MSSFLRVTKLQSKEIKHLYYWDQYLFDRKQLKKEKDVLKISDLPPLQT